MSTSREVAVYDPTAIDKVVEPWLRQPNEPDDAWLYFQQYRDQRLPRGWRKIPGSTARIQECARDYRWAARVHAYDEMCEAHALHERLEAIGSVARDAGARDAEFIMRAYDLMNVEVQKLLAMAETPEFKQTSVMKPGELVKLADLVMKMKRLTTGEATENVAHVVRNFDQLTDDERIRLWELEKKAGTST